MKTICDPATRQKLIQRISSLNENSQPQWGKMNVYQMLKHCSMWEEMALGKRTFKRVFLGRIFGRIALKDMLRDQPIKPNLPTVPEFKTEGNGDVAAEKQKWISLIDEHANGTHDGFIHPFFGKLTKEQAGVIAYKHTDHHLRQFSC